MEHGDGIAVYLTTPSGSRYPPWPNPYQKRHPDFKGSLGSRQIVVPPGSRFAIDIEFSASFKLYSATGVAIIIVIEDKSSQLSRDDNSQVFYLDARKMDIRKKHRFESFAFWEREGEIEPSEYLPLEMPTPNPAYPTASADWLDNSEWYEANTGCVAVWVIRGKLNEDEHDPDYERGSLTNPPPQLRTIDSGWPKVIDGQWLRNLESINGLEYVFEFVNMEPDAVDQNQPEASPEFSDDRRLRLELDYDDNEPVEEASNKRPSGWDDEEYRGEADFAAHDSAPKKRTTVDRRRNRLSEPSRKRQRTDTLADRTARTTGPVKASQAEAMQTTGKAHDDQDDEEELPTTQAPEVKEEATSERESSRTQEPTPPPDQTQVRETTAELYGVTPERDNQPVHLAAGDGAQGEVRQERLSEAEGLDNPGKLDEAEDFELAMEMARINRNQIVHDAETAYQREIAQIRARQRTYARREQA